MVYRLVCYPHLVFGEGGDQLTVGVGDVGHDAAPDRVKEVLGKLPNTPLKAALGGLKRLHVSC